MVRGGASESGVVDCEVARGGGDSLTAEKKRWVQGCQSLGLFTNHLLERYGTCLVDARLLLHG